jgi:hypothetical protein
MLPDQQMPPEQQMPPTRFLPSPKGEDLCISSPTEKQELMVRFFAELLLSCRIMKGI